MPTHRKRSGLAGTGTVNLAGSALTCPCHVCAFYNSPDELHEVLLPFLKEGLEAGDRVVTIVNPGDQADQAHRLTRCGVDVPAAQRNGQLDIETWDNAYLRGGRFDLEEMVGFVQESITTGQQRGFARTRGWANMDWALTGAPGVERLALYESRVNFILPLHNDASVCAYDVTRFPASVLEDVARAHPYLLADGFVQSNPHYVPPETLVPEYEKKLS
jgi:DcmR-like sensory protein